MEKQQSGAIVLVSSVAGKGYAGRSHVGYSTTKAALISMAQTVACRYAEQGIRCNAVVPGLIHTPLVARLAHEYHGGDYDGLVARRANEVPMKKMGYGSYVLCTKIKQNELTRVQDLMWGRL